MNLVSMGMKYLGPVVATQIASKLGIKSPMVTKLIVAALPTVLAALSGKAASSGGAGSVFDMVKNIGGGGPSDLEKMLSGDDAGQYATNNAGMLGNLLGGGAMDSLVGALSKHAGVPDTASKSLLGMIAPAAFGSMQDVVQEQNLDANGLASFMTSQNANISDAIPSEFADMLGGTGLLDAVRPAAAASIPTPPPMPEAKSGGGLLKWAIPAVIVAGLGWYFLGNSTPEMPEMPNVAELAAGQDFNVGGVDLGEKFGGVMGGLTDTFGGITDQASAEAALPSLEGATTQLGEIGDMVGQMPDTAQTAFGGIVGTALGALRPMIQSAIDASGAGAILQPVADGLLAKLEAMAG
jgi:hypothetical protein